MDNWTELIDDLVAGRWMNPETQELASVPFESIVIEIEPNGLIPRIEIWLFCTVTVKSSAIQS